MVANVEDMIITRSDYVAIFDVKLHAFHEFEMKYLGLICYFLGKEAASLPKGYVLSQCYYANEIIHRVRLTDNKVVDTPI